MNSNEIFLVVADSEIDKLPPVYELRNFFFSPT